MDGSLTTKDRQRNHFPTTWLPLTLGSSRRMAEQTGKYEESLGVVALRKEVMDHLPEPLCWVTPHTAKAIFLRQSTSLCGINLRRAISLPTGVTLLHPLEIKLGCWVQLGAISVISLTTKGDLWGLWDFNWPSTRPSAGKSQPWCTSWSFLHTNRPSRGSHMLWITDSSKPVAQGQSQCLTKAETESLQIYLLCRNKYK